MLVAIVVMMMTATMLPGMFLMPLASALIASMNPFVTVPMAGNPDELVATVPITHTVVIRPITYLDRESDRVGALLGKHASGQQSHCKNCEFRFHNHNINYS